jgi:hypothetical protein
LLQSCQFEPHPLWKKADEKTMKEKAKEIRTSPRYYSYISDIDFSVNFLIFWMNEGIKQHISLS